MEPKILFIEGRKVFSVLNIPPEEAIIIFCSVCPLFPKCNPKITGKEKDEIKPRTRSGGWKRAWELLKKAI